jgi:hypothetical protein
VLELQDFLDGLFQEDADKHAGWSEAVNGLRGRLVRYPRPHVNDTEIIGVDVACHPRPVNGYRALSYFPRRSKRHA